MTVGATSPAPAVVVTADLELLDHVLAVAAAAGVEPEVVADAGAVRPLWTAARTVIVGVDQAARVADLVLPRRAEIFVVGEEADRDQVCAWSLPLGAAVVLLPDGASRLTTALADASGMNRGAGRVVAVVGGSGGVGASTVAAALAVVAAQRGLATLLVDADPLSGGIDLLLAAERLPGWRWPRLSTARGHLGNLTGHLPHVDGLDVLSMSRSPAAPTPGPDGEQMKAVLLSAARSHELVLVDVPRQLTPGAREALRRADAVLLVALAQLRGVAAAQQMVGQLEEACTALHLLVRLSRPRGLPPEAVADGLGVGLLATVADEAAVALGCARGEAPGRSPRSGLAKSCRTVLDELDLADRSA